MPTFHDADASKLVVGVSKRHFIRLATDSGNHGLNFGRGNTVRLKWTMDMLERIIAWKLAHPIPGRTIGSVDRDIVRSGKRLGKVLRNKESKLLSG